MSSTLALVLLAPSEEKAPGGQTGGWQELAAQAWVRQQLQALVGGATDEDLARILEVKGKALQRAREEAEALGPEALLLPALERYQGVAFKALGAASLPREAWERLWVLSNLRGLVRGDEGVPAYKVKLGSLPGLKAHWKQHLPGMLAGLPEGEVWELLPGEHASLLQGWTRPRHTVEIVDERGRTLSHASKHYRGLLARHLLGASDARPDAVLHLSIPGCRWNGSHPNPLGGQRLILVVP